MTDRSNLLTPNGAAFIAAFKALGKPGQLETDARVDMLGDGLVGIKSTALFRANIAVYDGPNRYRVEPKAWDWTHFTPLHHLDKHSTTGVAAYALDVYEQGRAAVARIVLGNPSPVLALDAAKAAGEQH